MVGGDGTDVLKHGSALQTNPQRSSTVDKVYNVVYVPIEIVSRLASILHPNGHSQANTTAELGCQSSAQIRIALFLGCVPAPVPQKSTNRHPSAMSTRMYIFVPLAGSAKNEAADWSLRALSTLSLARHFILPVTAFLMLVLAYLPQKWIVLRTGHQNRSRNPT